MMKHFIQVYKKWILVCIWSVSGLLRNPPPYCIPCNHLATLNNTGISDSLIPSCTDSGTQGDTGTVKLEGAESGNLAHYMLVNPLFAFCMTQL